MDRTVYHLDGPGELNHIDALLAVEELDAIQWIQGEGNPSSDYYIDLYQKILSAGKQVQLSWCSLEVFEKIIQEMGSGKGFHHPMVYVGKDDKEYALHMLKKLGIEK